MGPVSIGGRGMTISLAGTVPAGAADGTVDSFDGIGGSVGGATASATGDSADGTGCTLTSVIVSGGGGVHSVHPAVTRAPRVVIIQIKVIGIGEPFTASRPST